MANLGEMLRVLHTTEGAQAAVMALEEGQVSGEFANEHPDSEQWLFLLDGGGSVRVGERPAPLAAGDLLVIPKGALHQVTGPNRTLSFYSPPAYPEDG